MSVVYQLFCHSHTLVGFVQSGKCVHVQWIAVHLQQKIAKQQNHNQINYYEYHYQFSGVILTFSKSTLTWHFITGREHRAN